MWILNTGQNLYSISDLFVWVEHLELGVGGTVRSVMGFWDPTVSTVSDTSNGWICADWLWKLWPEKVLTKKLLILGKMEFLLLGSQEDMLLMSWWAQHWRLPGVVAWAAYPWQPWQTNNKKQLKVQCQGSYLSMHSLVFYGFFIFTSWVIILCTFNRLCIWYSRF